MFGLFSYSPHRYLFILLFLLGACASVVPSIVLAQSPSRTASGELVGSDTAENHKVKPSMSPKKLVLGVISSNPKNAVKRSMPMARYLASNLSHHGIEKGHVVVAKDHLQMSRWLVQGRVDIVSESVFSAQALVRRSEGELIARRWKSGVAEYSSVFFTLKDNSIHSFDDLVGKTVVFEDRESTSAFYIPAAVLIEQGYSLFELTSPRETPPPGTIGYLFADELTTSGGEINMYTWVYNGIVAAAAFSDVDWENEIPELLRDKMKIFYRSKPVPRTLDLVRPNMDVRLKEDIKAVLFSAHLSEEGQKALRKYKKTKKFDAIDEQTLSGIEWVEKLKPLVDKSLML
ncbi:phosphate/phosphite/phosphonate ABC transporter substrate-binding protein [Vibrio tapetis]|uniref:Putative alkylphosphonate ABC transporter n=1 Tax=Vibrio tapetis subsp. tapetis TaxID=1671868 RepID=A0A2N8Z9W6_9VIBR|nr:phosphate/phosphite/phosphonate ABC transporter substrate-binding protein [Vibrio tapetis]SON48705.1 putative alkylphosphonate ABC transporter [Vibrio tapetis subsp. tapetis]